MGNLDAIWIAILSKCLRTNFIWLEDCNLCWNSVESVEDDQHSIVGRGIRLAGLTTYLFLFSGPRLQKQCVPNRVTYMMFVIVIFTFSTLRIQWDSYCNYRLIGCLDKAGTASYLLPSYLLHFVTAPQRFLTLSNLTNVFKNSFSSNFYMINGVD